MLRVGIVGLGAISGTHLDAVRRLGNMAELAAVCDCIEEKRKNVPGVPFYKDLEAMLQKEHLDCLHICLPHNLHSWAAELAARYGVHVFMEKPAGLCTKEIETLEAKEGIRKVHVGICLQNRYNATTRKALETLGDGTYGKLRGCKAVVTWDRRENYYEKDPWRGKADEAGGGVMLSQAIHTMDLMCLFCGQILWAKGMMGNLLLETIEVEDTACAQIQFQEGRTGIFYGSVGHCNNSSVEMELVLEKGILIIKNNRLVLQQNHEELILAEDEILPGGKDYYGAGHYHAVKAFYEKAEGKDEEVISLAEAKKVSRLIDMIEKSAKENRRVYWGEDIFWNKQ